MKTILLLLLCASASLRGAEVTFEWDANAEPNVAGYHVFTGTNSRTYSVVSDTKNTESATTVPTGQTRWIAVTAYVTNGLESDFSDELIVSAVAAPSLSFTNRTIASSRYPVDLRIQFPDGVTAFLPAMTAPQRLSDYTNGTVFTARVWQLGATNIISDWSAPKTNNPPAKPTIRLRLTLQSAADPAGPWTGTAHEIAMAVESDRRFFRTQLEIEK